MASYIARFLHDAVLRKNGQAFFAITCIGGKFIPFVKKSEKPFRADGYVSKKPSIEKTDYQAVMTQVTAIFAEERETAQPNLTIRPGNIEISKTFSYEENERIKSLATNRIRIRDDGTLIMYHNKNKKTGKYVEYKFHDIFSAIRKQDHVHGKVLWVS